MKRLALALPVLLAACATVGDDLPVVTPTYGGGADIQRFDAVTVRAFEQRGLSRLPLLGTTCEVAAPGLRGQFIAPAVVRLPVFQGATRDARITCRIAGRTADATVPATNVTAGAANEGVRISTGTSGTSVRVGVSVRDRRLDRFDYPAQVAVIFR
ncbi:MAG: hypothetical protein ACU0CO_11555 [Shimia sp.]